MGREPGGRWLGLSARIWTRSWDCFSSWRGVRSFLMNVKGMGKRFSGPGPVEDGGRSMSPGCQEAVCNNHNKAGDGTRDPRQPLQKRAFFKGLYHMNGM